MSVAHLEGKRTGRPRGVRSTAPWVRDAIWAYRQLCREGGVNSAGGVNGGKSSKPPSKMAEMLLALGREHPDRLVMLLMQMEGRGPANGAAPALTLVRAPEEAPAGPRRVKTVTLRRYQLAQFIIKDTVEPWMAALPDSFVVEEVVIHPKVHTVTLTIRSEEFEEVPEGEPVPHVELPLG